MKTAKANWQIRQRLLSFFLAFLAIFFLLFLRLADVQLRRGDEFVQLASENRYFFKRHLVERGVILDRYQQALLKNRQNYYQLLQADRLYSPKKLLTKEAALPLLATASSQLTRDFSRIYLFGQSLAHVLGYVSGVTAEDLSANNRLAFDEQLGRLGLEKYFNEQLQAQAGREIYEVNALGQKQQFLGEENARLGQNIQTSLDPYLSQVAWEAMAERRGAVIIMDAQTGQILSLVSSPSFDPNLFEAARLAKLDSPQTSSEAQMALRQALTDDRQVFFNRAVNGTYPPGSVFKLLTALAALEAGVLDQNTQFLDEGTLKVGDYEYANWYYTQYGRTEGEISLVRAIARSNDIYFYKAAELLGPTRLADYARLFGLGQPTGVELSSEASGLVPDPAWKERTRGETWYLGNTYHFGIGQGDLLVTPLQIAQLLQALGNQGKKCRASLLMDAVNCQDLAIKAENLDLIIQGMLAVAETGGTAFPLFDYNQQVIAAQSENLGKANWQALSASEQIKLGAIAGKTGTAEFGGVDERGYRQTHAWFAGLVGLDKQLILANWERAKENGQMPNAEQSKWLEALARDQLPKELVIVVLLESDESTPYREGSADSAPIVRTLLRWMTAF